VIIFVAGIHGVGKTYLGGPTANQLGIHHATASQLIREERGLPTWGSDKRVSSVDENQVALISAVRRLRASGQKLLLDGHFVLRTGVGDHTEIDVQVFSDLGISAVVLLEAPPETVLSRLAIRGDASWSIPEVAEFSNREASHACIVASKLGIGISRLNCPNQSEFRSQVELLLGM
jgi:adenylate kinase